MIKPKKKQTNKQSERKTRRELDLRDYRPDNTTLETNVMILIHPDRLVGLVVRRLPRERKIPGSNPAFGVESYQ